MTYTAVGTGLVPSLVGRPLGRQLGRQLGRPLGRGLGGHGTQRYTGPFLLGPLPISSLNSL